MTDAQKLKVRQLMKEVAAETEEAERKFRNGLDAHPPEVAIVVLMEEVGKLSRAVQRVQLAANSEVANEWRREHRHRIVSCISVLQRFSLMRF